MSAIGKIQRRTRRKGSIRRKVSGSAECPRITVFRSLKHIYAQAIDDVSGRTLAQASTLNDDGVEQDSRTVESGAAVGKTIAERLKQQGVERAVFDRNGYLYHGRVKAVADGIREAGLKM